MNNDLIKAAILVLLKKQESYSCHAVAMAVAARDGEGHHQFRDYLDSQEVKEYEATLRAAGHDGEGGTFVVMLLNMLDHPREGIPGMPSGLHYGSDFQRGVRVGFLMAQLNKE